MGASAEKVVCYNLSYDSNFFLIFMNQLVGKLSDEERKKSIIIMENLPAHLTGNLFQYYK